MRVPPYPYILGFALLLGAINTAHAVSNPYSDGGAFDLNLIAATEPGCEDFCSIVMDKATGKSLSLEGGTEWAQPDDQWCANHAVGTNPTILPEKNIGKGDPNISCNVPLLAGDSSCSEVNLRLQRCKLHGSQIETQCAAFVAVKDATKGEKVVLALDTAAAATCTMACAGGVIPGAGAAMVTACQYAGASASAGEIIQTLRSKSSDIQKYIGIAGGALGGGLAASMIVNGGAIADEKTLKQTFSKGGNVVAEYEQVGDKVTKVSGPVEGFPADKLPDTNPAGVTRDEPTSENSGKGTACRAAIVFGAMTGLRVFNMKRNTDSKKEACTQVRELVSSSLAAGFGPLAGTTANAGNTGNASTGTAGTQATTAGGANSGASGNSARTVGGSVASGREKATECLNSKDCTEGTLGSATKKSAASDAGLLSTSGLANMLRKDAAQIPIDRLLEGNKGADALIGAALAGQAGALGNAIGDIAKAAQAAADKLGGESAPSTIYKSGTAVAQGPSKSEENPFKLMGDSALGASTAENFAQTPFTVAAPCTSSDIWHSNCENETIFQIVSGKITQSQDKIEKMHWALPLNRRLAGEKK